MEVDSEMTQEVGEKREIQNCSEMAVGRRTSSRKIAQADHGLEWMDALEKEVDETNTKRLVARWNAENPDATPLVPEALTEQQKASLLQEESARELVLAEAYAARMEEEDMARAEEERDPNLDDDDDDRDYQEYREHWDWKTAREFGSFEDTSKFISLLVYAWIDYFGSLVSVIITI
jgi:hypothetical protein